MPARCFSLAASLAFFVACGQVVQPPADDAVRLQAPPVVVTAGGGSARSARYRIQVRIGGAAPTGDASGAAITTHLGAGPFRAAQ